MDPSELVSPVAREPDLAPAGGDIKRQRVDSLTPLQHLTSSSGHDLAMLLHAAAAPKAASEAGSQYTMHSLASLGTSFDSRQAKSFISA